MLRRILIALSFLALPSLAEAADITGNAKVRAGDAVVIGNTRIRLGGIDAPAVDQLCLNTKTERWTCGVAARDELAKYAEGKSWACHTRSIDRRGRTAALRGRRRGHSEMAGAQRLGTGLHPHVPRL